ncbi:MAG: glycosyltransferase [Anaerolineales bacterium]
MSQKVRVLMLSKACVVGAYQRKLEEIAACSELELMVAVPPAWRDERGVLRLERAHTQGYELAVTPMAFNGSFHLHFFPRVGQLLARFRPDVAHIDEEPYNLATWHALRLAQRHGAKTLFFSWQNLLRRYPFPFNYFEREVLRRADAAIVGNREARDVWRAKGYAGPISVIPQFGVDPEIFKPHPSPPAPPPSPIGREERGEVFTIGYAGRLIPEKGLDLLLRAVAQLPPAACVHLIGSGPAQPRLERLATRLGLRGRVKFERMIPSTQMPGYFAQLDCLALPSRTRPNWKEQFGRVLIEAMACGVPVVGSTCGEIPNVIADAGLIFPENDEAALAAHLRELMAKPDLRAALAARGRARVLAHYTQKKIAEQTVAVYRALAD